MFGIIPDQLKDISLTDTPNADLAVDMQGPKAIGQIFRPVFLKVLLGFMHNGLNRNVVIVSRAIDKIRPTSHLILMQDPNDVGQDVSRTGKFPSPWPFPSGILSTPTKGRYDCVG